MSTREQDRKRRGLTGDHQTTDGDRAGAGPTTRSLSPRPDAELPSPASPEVQASVAVQRQAAAAAIQRDESDVFGWGQSRAGGKPARAAADRIPSVAAQGVSGSPTALPHQAAIQASFGHHDVSGIGAHVGGAAAEAATAINANAYAAGDQVAFRSSPDLSLAAHEAAHVVQQRGGVQLSGGVGQAGDRYEQHADAVADAVVRGESAAPLLDELAPLPIASTSSSPNDSRPATATDHGAVQRRIVVDEATTIDSQTPDSVRAIFLDRHAGTDAARRARLEALIDDDIDHSLAEALADGDTAPADGQAQIDVSPAGGSGQDGGSAVEQQGTEPGDSPPAVVPLGDRVTWLPERIARAVGIYETNRGGDAPEPEQSGLQTTAGVHASVRSMGQYVVSRAISELIDHEELRSLATPPLTLAELQTARDRAAAMRTLLDLVENAGAANTSVDDFIAAHGGALTDAGATADDVRVMFQALGLHADVDAAHDRTPAALDLLALIDAARESGESPDDFVAANQEAIDAVGIDAARAAELVTSDARLPRPDQLLAETIPDDQRLGIGSGSLPAYIRRTGNWGENSAAWQRVAVERLDGAIGVRIVAAAEFEGGAPMMSVDFRGQVSDLLAQDPQMSDEDVVRAIASAHNAGPDYPDGVWGEYHRLYP